MRKALILLLVLFVGCSQNSNSDRSHTSKKTLNINFTREIPTSDPRRCGEPISSTFIFMLYEGLTKHTPQSSSQLAMAEKVDVSTDQKVYTFTLRDAYWNNGEPVTAYDFEGSWKDMLDPNFPSPNAPLLYSVKNAIEAKKGEISLNDVGIQSLDAKTLQVTLSKPTPYFLEITSFCALFPTYHPLDRVAPSYEKINPELVTNGPFEVADVKMLAHVQLKRNPHYHEKERIKLDEVSISFVQDDNTALEMFENNEIDLAGLFFSEIPTEALQSEKLQKLVHKRDVAATSFFSFNMREAPFDNPHIRKAFHYAIDRQMIVDNITELSDQVASGFIPPIQLSKKGGLPIDQSPQLAKKEFKMGLKELNLDEENFPTLTLSYNNSPVNRKIAQEVQYQVAKLLGIEIKLEGLDFIHYIQNLTSHQYQLALCKVFAQYNDPMDILIRFADQKNVKNYPGWYDNDFAKLIQSAAVIESPVNREFFYKKAEEKMNEQTPISPLFHDRMVHLAQPRVKGFFISSIGSLHIDNIDLED